MEKIIKLHSHKEAQVLFGPHDEIAKSIEQAFKVNLSIRKEDFKVKGTLHSIKNVTPLIDYILKALRQGEQSDFSKDQIAALILSFKKQDGKIDKVSLESGCKHIGPKTGGQIEYVEAIKNHDIVFGIGPAGTGKTYLAMACAVETLKRQEVRRIILTRPAIEAGESLGFLPGGVSEKISPYLRPLYDALYDMMEAEKIERYLETGIIEVAPLAYMRGRTLNDAFIILDEAQNCTAEQMKMFLTRLGFDSKAVITGDITQSDLPDSKPIGLLQAQEILSAIDGIKFIYFSALDVVRHALVQRIIEAYDLAKTK